MTVEIDISQVPEPKRSDLRFLALLANMQLGCADPNLVHAICIHEAAHAFCLSGQVQRRAALTPQSLLRFSPHG